MSVLEKVQAMKAQFQSQADVLGEIEAELQAQPAPVPTDSDLVAQLEKAKADSKALVKERDALRAAIQTEIDDKKKDTKRLEAAVEPVEEAPVPVIPDVPAPTPAPEAPVEEAPAPAPEAPVEEAPAAPAPEAPVSEAPEVATGE